MSFPWILPSADPILEDFPVVESDSEVGSKIIPGGLYYTCAECDTTVKGRKPLVVKSEILTDGRVYHFSNKKCPFSWTGKCGGRPKNWPETIYELNKKISKKRGWI